MPISNDATAQGFTIIEAVLDGTEVAELARALETSVLNRSRAGARHLMNHPAVSAVAVDPRMVAIAGRFLGETAIPYKATLFDKSPARNWLVAWHQNTALPLCERRENPEWGPWSIKAGVTYALAPASALAQVVAQDDQPVAGVSWYEAAAYAAFAGKSLPTVTHWLRASNLDVVATDYRFLIPLSNLQSTQPWPVGSSNAVNSWGLYDVAGNVREWCWNESGGRRAILGGSWADQVRDARAVDNAAGFDRSAINGFRLARYADAEQVLEDFGGPMTPATRPDYNKVRPVSDETFEVYRRLYAYEPKPPQPVVESVDESSGLWRRERIRFQAPYGNEQVIAYVFLPKQSKPPYQAVMYMGDGATLRPGSGDTIQPDHSVLRSGRAMIYPIYKGSLDRYVPIVGGRHGAELLKVEQPKLSALLRRLAGWARA